MNRPANAVTFTVVIATFNRPTELIRTLESILTQEKLPNQNWTLEVIVVNDGSTKSYSDVKSLCKIHQSIRFFENADNLGVATARNKAATLANGTWLVFIDDDDEMEVGYLSILFKQIFSYPSTFVFWGGVNFITCNGSQVRTFSNKYDKKQDIVKEFLSIGLAFGVAVRKQTFFDTGAFDTSYEVGEDTEFFVRILDAEVSIRAIECIATRKHEESDARLSSGFKRYSNLLIYEKIFNKHKKFFRKFPYVYICLLFWSMRVHLMNQNSIYANESIRCLMLSGYNLKQIKEKYKMAQDLDETLLNDTIHFPLLKEIHIKNLKT